MMNGGMMGVGTDGLPIVGAGMGMIAEMADDMQTEQQMGGRELSFWYHVLKT